MKRLFIICVLCGSILFANETENIDRTGWHFGIGITGIGGFIDCDTPTDGCDFEDGSFLALPTLNMVAEYGVTSQFSWSLEHQGYVVAALIAIQGKYYFHDAKESAYITGGIETLYALDYGIDNTAAVKAGVGYAWNHNEIEFAVHQNVETLFSFAWRYKF